MATTFLLVTVMPLLRLLSASTLLLSIYTAHHPRPSFSATPYHVKADQNLHQMNKQSLQPGCACEAALLPVTACCTCTLQPSVSRSSSHLTGLVVLPWLSPRSLSTPISCPSYPNASSQGARLQVPMGYILNSCNTNTLCSHQLPLRYGILMLLPTALCSSAAL